MAIRIAATAALSLALAAGSVVAQTAPVTQGAPEPAPVAVVAPAQTSVVIPEGTEVRIRFEDPLSSKTSTQGDRFSITSDAPIELAGGTVIKSGYRGVGEVTHSKKSGMMGQGGELNVRFDYIKIGDTKVRLRGSQGREGDGRVGATVVLTVLFGPLGLLMKGKNIEIPRGQSMTVYVDADAEIDLPLASPPTA